VVAQTIMLLTCIGYVPGSNLGRKAGILRFSWLPSVPDTLRSYENFGLPYRAYLVTASQTVGSYSAFINHPSMPCYKLS